MLGFLHAFMLSLCLTSICAADITKLGAPGRWGNESKGTDGGWHVRYAVTQQYLVAVEAATKPEELQLIRGAVQPSLDDDNVGVRYGAAKVFEKLAERTDQFETVARQHIRSNLLKILTDIDSSVSKIAAHGIVELCKTASSAERSSIREEILQLMRKHTGNFADEGCRVRSAAAQIFVTLAKQAAEAEEMQLIQAAIFPLLSDKDWRISYTACQGLEVIYGKVNESERERMQRILSPFRVWSVRKCFKLSAVISSSYA